jgi:hypothetical protein
MSNKIRKQQKVEKVETVWIDGKEYLPMKASAEHSGMVELDGKKVKAEFHIGEKNKKGRTLKAVKVTFAGIEGALYLR